MMAGGEAGCGVQAGVGRDPDQIWEERTQVVRPSAANLDPKGVKAYVQIPIELGYRIASLFAKRSQEAQKNAEMLGLMVNDPNIKPEELDCLKMPILVIAGTKDMIKESHTRLIYSRLSNAKLVLIEGDHFIANKKAEEFNRAVELFLESDA